MALLSILEGIQAYSSSSEDGEQAAHVTKAPTREEVGLSHPLKRQHIETTNKTTTCHRQLPSAADLLSQPHTNLGIMSVLMHPLVCPKILFHKLLAVVSCSDHLQVQYIPDTSALASRHHGRKRQFPHVEGNFATRVYIRGRHYTHIVMHPIYAAA